MDESELDQTINEVSRDAFALGRAAVESGDFAAGAARARELNDRLAELWPRVEASPEAARPKLSRAWSDARLDLGYLLSGGELAASLRLGHILRGRMSGDEETAR